MKYRYRTVGKEAATKDELQRYYSDMSKALQLTADMADSDRLYDPRAKGQVKALVDDAKRQLVAIRKGTAPL